MKTSGFTLVELIAIMVLLGILAAIGIPRLFSIQTFSGRGFHDQTLAMIRYAQKVAVAQRTNVFVNVNAATNRICLTFVTDPTCGGAVASVVDPADNANFSKTAPTGTTLGTTVTSFSFSGLGRPSQNASITVTYDGVPHVITVEAETGYVR